MIPPDGVCLYPGGAGRGAEQVEGAKEGGREGGREG